MEWRVVARVRMWDIVRCSSGVQVGRMGLVKWRGWSRCFGVGGILCMGECLWFGARVGLEMWEGSRLYGGWVFVWRIVGGGDGAVIFVWVFTRGICICS